MSLLLRVITKWKGASHGEERKEGRRRGKEIREEEGAKMSGRGWRDGDDDEMRKGKKEERRSEQRVEIRK